MKARAAVDAVITAQPEHGAEGELKAINPTPFINRTAVKNFLLEHAAATRAHKYQRVSLETLRDINNAVRAVMISKVRTLPSKGKTI